MNVTYDDLRGHMRTLSRDELQAIVSSSADQFTDDAKRAAFEELATRPVPTDAEQRDVTIDGSASTRDALPEAVAYNSPPRLPALLRDALWVSGAYGPFGTLILLVALAVTTYQQSVMDFVAADGARVLGLSAIGWLIFLGILRRREYVRLALAAICLAFATYTGIADAVGSRISLLTVATIIFLAFFAWKLLFGREIVEYYQKLRRAHS